MAARKQGRKEGVEGQFLLTLTPDTSREEDCRRADPTAPPPIRVSDTDDAPRLLEQTRVDEPVADGGFVVDLAEGKVRPLGV
jgi:hypothetical protein